jgi:GR25 family glycosyltransferase involved in LPS biosynthesis
MTLPDLWGEICSSKVVVLGLKRFAFRREYSAAKLAEVGFKNIELIDAFDGFHDDIDGTLTKLRFQLNPNLKDGMKGFCISKLLLWTSMIEKNLPYLVVFEDDVDKYTANVSVSFIVTVLVDKYDIVLVPTNGMVKFGKTTPFL